MFAELDRLGAVGATVPFGGRAGAGAGGQVGRVVLSRLEGAELVESELGWAREELAFAVAAPVWDRFVTGRRRRCGIALSPDGFAFRQLDRLACGSRKRGGPCVAGQRAQRAAARGEGA